jgi:hypothetical protein
MILTSYLQHLIGRHVHSWRGLRVPHHLYSHSKRQARTKDLSGNARSSHMAVASRISSIDAPMMAETTRDQDPVWHDPRTSSGIVAVPLTLNADRMASELLTASPKTFLSVHAGRRVACSLTTVSCSVSKMEFMASADCTLTARSPQGVMLYYRFVSYVCLIPDNRTSQSSDVLSCTHGKIRPSTSTRSTCRKRQNGFSTTFERCSCRRRC